MEPNLEQMQDTFDRDQNDAALNDISRQVARHFLMMRAAKMSEASALILARDFQKSLMDGGIDVEFVLDGVSE